MTAGAAAAASQERRPAPNIELNIRPLQDNHYALALIGVDRPGIVAAVASGLSELGCNLEDVTTSLLSGHFAMVLEFSAPEGLEAGRIRQHLAAKTAGARTIHRRPGAGSD